MKKLIMLVTTIIVSMIPIGISDNYDNHCYYLTATVIESDNDFILIQDDNGDIWSMYIDGYYINDVVKLTMYNNNTIDNITDDIIAHIQKY